MKTRSAIALLIGLALVSSIFTPVIGAKHETGKPYSYKNTLIQGTGSQNLKIDPVLSEAIKNSKGEEVKDVIILVKKDKNKDNVRNFLIDGVQPRALNNKVKFHKIVNSFSAKVKAKDIEEIAKLEDVEKVFEDIRVTVALDDSVPIIRANSLWSKYDGSGVKVAVIDTGIDSSHPDLRGNVIDEISFINDEMPEDGFGHGTHVAGIVAGSGISSGGKYKGVAPGASLMNVKVLGNEGYGTASTVISGIEYAVDNGADIISMSLGAGFWPPDGTDPVALAANAAVDAGVVVVVAAGNSGGPFLISSPATAEKVISVGASQKDDRIASYSSEGPTWDHRVKPDVIAPGGAGGIDSDPAGLGIVSTKAAGSMLDRWLPEYRVDKYYLALSGTSMATPHVSGVAAILLQANPHLTPAQVKQKLMNTGVDLGYTPITQGAGRIDSVSAVGSIVSISPLSLSYIINPGSNNKETLMVSNNGDKKLKLSISKTGDIDVKFSGNTISLNPGETKNITASIGIPSGSSAGLHYGSIRIHNGNMLLAEVPVLVDSPMTFIRGTSEINDTIKIKLSEDYSRGTNYYYFNVPQGVPGISSTLDYLSMQAYVDIYLIDPDGEFVDYAYVSPEKTSATVSTADPKPGRWMMLIDSWVFDPSISEVPVTLTTYLNSLKIEPSLWIPASTVSAGSSIIQNFTVTNTGTDSKSVIVDAYVGVPNSSASGSFYGEVSYFANNGSNMTHVFEIPDGSSQYTFTLTALNNTGFIWADIFDPGGMWTNAVYAGYWEPSSASVKFKEPIAGTWRAEVRMGYAPTDTIENYRGDYAVLSKNRTWITSEPDNLFIPGLSIKKFASTMKTPADANGYYTGELTIRGDAELMKVPISVNVGTSIAYPGDFNGDIKNKAWKYYTTEIYSGNLNVSIDWNNVANDLDLFVMDPNGKTVGSSTQSYTLDETVNMIDPVAGTWTIGVHGYNVTGTQTFHGILG